MLLCVYEFAYVVVWLCVYESVCVLLCVYELVYLCGCVCMSLFVRVYVMRLLHQGCIEFVVYDRAAIGALSPPSHASAVIPAFPLATQSRHNDHIAHPTST